MLKFHFLKYCESFKIKFLSMTFVTNVNNVIPSLSTDATKSLNACSFWCWPSVSNIVPKSSTDIFPFFFGSKVSNALLKTKINVFLYKRLKKKKKRVNTKNKRENRSYFIVSTLDNIFSNNNTFISKLRFFFCFLFCKNTPTFNFQHK